MAGNTGLPGEAGFDADAFRTAIVGVMTMGAAPDTSKQVIFRWSPEKTYENEDSGGNPWTWTSPPTSDNTPADVKVPCAVEFSGRPAGSQDTVIGQFDTSYVVVTLLDDQYTLVEGADLLVIDSSIYEVQFVAPPLGLFGVGVFQIHALARDEA